MDWYCENVIHGDLDIEKVYESDTVLAFHHTKPFWEHHIVAVPKEHIESMASPGARDSNLMAEIMKLMAELAEEFQEKHGGCHIGTNVGTYQSARHLHWYIHAGECIRDRQGVLLSERNKC